MPNFIMTVARSWAGLSSHTILVEVGMLCKLNLIFLCFYFFINKQLIFAVWCYSGSFCCICVISNLSHNNTWIKCLSSNIVSMQVFRFAVSFTQTLGNKIHHSIWQLQCMFFCRAVSVKVVCVRIYLKQFCQWYVLLSYLSVQAG